jgi:hypothetical protein
MTKNIKDKKEVVHKITELEHTPGEKYGLLVIGPKTEDLKNVGEV